jgi:DNA-binding response OmpR family regulator
MRTTTAITRQHSSNQDSTSRSRPVVLVAEESDVERVYLGDNLSADGFVVRVADCRQKALSVLATVPPVDVAVIDVNGHTLELLDAVRNAGGLAARIDPHVPILVLTSRVEELHRIRLLDRGGDDVLAKPYSYLELRARLAALLRRATARQTPRVRRCGALTIDLAARTAHVGDETVPLTGTEYRLLRTLASEPGRVFTRGELLHTVWGMSTASRAVDSHVHRVRKKLAAAGSDTRIELLWGVGYRLATPSLAG